MFKALLGNRKITDGRNNVSSDFCLLALDTLSRPFGYILTHGGPDHFGTHRLASALDTRMAQAVDNVKNAASKGVRDVGTSRAVADIDDEIRLTDIDRLKVQTRAGVVPKSPEFWVQRLLKSNGGPVDPQIADRVDDAA